MRIPAKFAYDPKLVNYKPKATKTEKKALTPKMIRYLALEGGGGKGNAYGGALKALRKYGVLKYDAKNSVPHYDTNKKGGRTIYMLDPQKLAGVSGTSAGAITAMLVSIGLTPEQIAALQNTIDFDSALKRKKMRQKPVSFGNKVIGTPTKMSYYYTLLEEESGLLVSSGWKTDLASDSLPASYRQTDTTYPRTFNRGQQQFDRIGYVKKYFDWKYYFKLRSGWADNYSTEALYVAIHYMYSKIFSAGKFFQRIIWFFKNPKTGQPKDQKMEKLKEHIFKGSVNYKNRHTFLYSMMYDYGIFDASELHALFELIITARVSEVLKARGANDKEIYAVIHKMNFTFRELHALFGIKLVLTGSNLETNKSHLFSVDHTPDFPVATAVRISMSIPFAFKPVNIRRPEWTKRNLQPPSIDYNGLWVDGGIFDNAPYQVFDNFSGKAQPQTLLLRLESDKRKNINEVRHFLWVYLGLLMGSAGEAKLSSSWEHPDYQHFITLPTEVKFGSGKKSLGMFDFKVPKALLKAFDTQSFKIVDDYFIRAKKDHSILKKTSLPKAG